MQLKCDLARSVVRPRESLWDILKTTFDVCQRELGVESYPDVVEIGYIRSRDRDRLGIDRQTAAYTEAIRRENGAIGMMMISGPVLQTISSLCHEMVHVAQMARGDLSAKDSYTSVWKGEEYDRRPKKPEIPDLDRLEADLGRGLSTHEMLHKLVEYLGSGEDRATREARELPWETEAYAMMFPLTTKVIRALSDEQVTEMISDMFGAPRVVA